MVRESSEEQKKVAMDAVWEGIIRRSNAKKDIEKALGEAKRDTEVALATSNRVVAGGVDDTAEKKRAEAKRKKIRKIVVSLLFILVVGLVGFAIFSAYRSYAASPVGQLKSIYKSKETNIDKLEEAYGDNYFDYYQDLYDGAKGMFNSGSATSQKDIDKMYKEMPKWSEPDIAKAQFCLVYAQRINDATVFYNVYSMMLAQKEYKKVNPFPDNLPLSEKEVENAMQNFIKKAK